MCNVYLEEALKSDDFRRLHLDSICVEQKTYMMYDHVERLDGFLGQMQKKQGEFTWEGQEKLERKWIKDLTRARLVFKSISKNYPTHVSM